MIGFGGHRKERKRRKGPSSCHRKGHWKNDCKHQQKWLKKKGQAAEADIASRVEDTEILMASYEDNTSQGKS